MPPKIEPLANQSESYESSLVKLDEPTVTEHRVAIDDLHDGAWDEVLISKDGQQHVIIHTPEPKFTHTFKRL